MTTTRRTLVLALTALLFFICTACVPAIKADERDTPVYRNFKEIPGVTAEEIAAIEALQQTRESLTYGMLFTTETFVREDGTCGGYSALFAEWMSNLFGITFVPRIYDWYDLINGFESGTIDFTGELTATPERREIYYMTDTFTERAIKAFRLRGSEHMGEIAKLRPVRYAFLSGTTTIEAVTSVSEFEIDIVLVETEEEAIEKLRAGEVDAFMAEEHGAAIFPDDIIGENIFPVVYSPISFSTTKKELEPIITVLDKYLKNGAFFHLIDLYNQGNQEYLQYKLISMLTEDEKAYLAAHQEGGEPVRIVAEYDTYPASFYNTQEKEWQGIAIDVLKEIYALCGLDFQIVNGTHEEWAVLLGMLEDGRASMVTELIYSSERKDRFLWAGAPYSVDSYALLSLAGHEDIGINQILYSRIGLVEDSAYSDVFREWFPDHQNVTEYASTDDGFAALERKELDLLMSSCNILLSATNFHENPGFKANLVFDRTYESTFGFHKDEALLCGIVSKAQSLVDTQNITDRWTRKVYDYRGKLARQQVPYLIGLSVLLVCVLALLVMLVVRNREMNKNLERIVRERTAQLEVASQAKGDFLSRMSHEIRTPLNAIIGMAQIARHSAQDESPKTVKAINEMISASGHLLGILNDVLDMSKIEAGKFALSTESFALLPAMEDVRNIIAQRCQEKSIRFEVSMDDISQLAVEGDKLRLKQVLINLLGNAVKFTGQGGVVRLLIRAQEITDRAATLTFTVSDEGIGMSDEQIARLFVAFEQADNSISARFGGTGLGLAISQNLVGQMGGEIAVASKSGEGSTFWFTLTLERTEMPAEPETVRTAAGVDLTGKRILLAEDIEINREILMELLKETNASFDEAEDGKRAVELFAASPIGSYDLVFMDIQMPNMDGYEATRTIRKMARLDAGSVPIIAMTANAYREDVENAFAAGMNGHVAKPIDLDKIMRLLEEMLG